MITFIYYRISKIIDHTEISTIPHLKIHKIKWRFQNFLEHEIFFNKYYWFWQVRMVRNFCQVDDFWGMTSNDASCKRNRIQNIFTTFFMFRYIDMRNFEISFSFIFWPKIAYFSIKNRFWIIFSILTIIKWYNFITQVIWSHTPKIVESNRNFWPPRA